MIGRIQIGRHSTLKKVMTQVCQVLALLLLASCKTSQGALVTLAIEQQALLASAEECLKKSPRTITDFPAKRSAGGKHDFFSEGPCWWPDPENPEGPYIRRDGWRNPDTYNEHKRALGDLHKTLITLVAAYRVTGDEKYANHARKYLMTWFVNAETRMNPSLLFGQAIQGIVTGRGIGIIDTVPLIEVAACVEVLTKSGSLTGKELAGVTDWFAQYVTWLTTHPYGLDERDNGNNHSTWWAAQVAAYARIVGRSDLLVMCRNQFKAMLPQQMAADGSFPEELARTRPYAYTLYNLDAWATLAYLASTKKDNLWYFQSELGGLRKAIDWMIPFLHDKSTWLREPDVTGFDKQPQQRDFLIFAAIGYRNDTYLETWKLLPPQDNQPSWNLLIWQDISLNLQ
ncbi:MAG: alginate lyase family protein [Lewinellaceae bacterium]|nr:alginate lyase family protein [Lewinellaceae bacterium]